MVEQATGLFIGSCVAPENHIVKGAWKEEDVEIRVCVGGEFD
jgi:hypothetical protein